MSDTLATYAFLPWLRRGVVSEIEREDGAMTGAARADVPITLELSAAGDVRPVTAAISLFGPGEVAAMDPRVVIRVIPKEGELDAEPNYFPSIEFDQPDFPWRFTPARAEATRGRLRPWLVLAVLRDDEIAEETPGTGDGRLPSITVANVGSLPRLSQSWAWAHVQVDGFDAGSEVLDQVVTHQPQRVRSRLLAPRRLHARNRYRAFLVPTFERGRRAGLKEAMDETVDGLALAWADDSSNVRIPYYYSWSFQTGEKGDFETLASRLRARAVDRGVGLRDMHVGDPDPALPAAASTPLAMEGALMSPQAASTVWNPVERATFADALAGLLNVQAEALENEGIERTVAPPLWARWQARVDRLSTAAGAQPAWFHELNADPRLRASAGLGAEVVRKNDQQLMAEAWNQVEGILEANAEMRRAQLAREASERLYQRHLAPLSSETFVQVTAPLHARFTLSPVTAREVLRRSPIPEGALAGGMRRALRAAGGVGRRVSRIRPAGALPLLGRLNLGDVRARPPRPTPEGMVTPGRLIDRLRDEGLYPRVDRPWLWGLLVLVLVLLSLLFVLFFPPLALVALVAAAYAAYRWRREWVRSEGPARVRRVLEGTATPRDVRGMEPAPGYVPGATDPGLWAWGPQPADLTPVQAAAATARFQEAFADLVGELNAPPRDGPRWEVADLGGIARGLTAKMNPRLTIPASVTHRLTIADWVTWEYGDTDPIEPIMAAPHIDTPMYEPLRDWSQEWLMPGIGTIPGDTATLVVTNQRFIESYMAGLTHEMARELLYHEYPTDQQGTYFRQFWDVRGVISAEGTAANPADLRDIAEIHTWPSGSDLGEHSGRTPPPRDGHLVLLIKGEVLRRYPTTMVYAIRTVIGDDGRRTLGEQQSFPVFEGRLDPDISFFGFDMLPDDARGNPDPAEDQGWYFVLQEQPTEPVFGLDADDGSYGGLPTSWNGLNWAHLAADQGGLDGLMYIDVDAELPNTTAVVAAPGEPALAWHGESGSGAVGSNGSDLAHITLQRPFRVAIHGSDMLPPEAP